MARTKMSSPVPELPVADVKRAQAYYRDKLGFDVEWTYPGEEVGAVSRGSISIFFRRTTGVINPSTHWVFAMDVDATHRELEERGANIVEDIEDKPWGMRQFTVEDCEGHRFHIHHDLP